jgi:hypothetical protein
MAPSRMLALALVAAFAASATAFTPPRTADGFYKGGWSVKERHRYRRGS